MVELANGSHTQLTAQCHINILMPARNNATYHLRRQHCLVVELGDDHDIILGQNWMRAEGAVISFPDQTCCIQRKDLILEFITDTPSTANDTVSVPRITAIRAKRDIQKGAKFYHVRVSNTPDSGTLPTPPQPREQSEYGLVEEDVPDHVTAEVRRILLEYHVVFDKPPGLPPEREVAHVIPLIPGSVPVYTPPYRLTPAETDLVHKTIKEYLMAGLIEPSTSPYGSPIIFVAKPHQPGKLRMCIDTRKLNAQTIAMRQPIPRQDMPFDELAGATVFSSLDLQSGHHQIRIRKEDVEKSAFITPFGSYNFLVMSSIAGYRYAPSIFTSYDEQGLRTLVVQERTRLPRRHTGLRENASRTRHCYSKCCRS
jgi:hypothetical protein